MRLKVRLVAALALLSAWLLAGCSRENSSRIDYEMGERTPIGPLTYTVIESSWHTQLGDVLKLRIPQQRFLLIRIAVTNGGGSEVSIPLLQLENYNGQSYRELEDGESISNWLGVLRTVRPAETLQGQRLGWTPCPKSSGLCILASACTITIKTAIARSQMVVKYGGVG